MPALEGAAAYAHDGSTEIGVLLSHGFTGSPVSMRPWADRLVEQGFSVRLPLLPGHGTTWQEMNGTTWSDWYGAVSIALAELRERCDKVFVFGLSMGGALCLRLAQDNGAAIAGVVLVNPSVMSLRKDIKVVGLLSKVVASVPAIGNDIAKPGVDEWAYPRTPLKAMASLTKLWALVRADLAKVDQPLVVLHSAVDHIVEPENSRLVLDGVSSADVTEVVLENSYHVATLDHDAELIFQTSVDFVRRISAGERV